VARTLLLDLDDTLVDTVPDLMPALNRLMQARSLPPFSATEVAAMIGDGVAMLVTRAFAANGRKPDGAAIKAFQPITRLMSRLTAGSIRMWRRCWRAWSGRGRQR